MKMTRLYSGDDGQSHFEDVEMDMSNTEVGRLGTPFNVRNLTFGVVSVENVPWHNMEEPAYIVVLEGEMELEVGDGTRRKFKAGDVILAEDMTGQGHITHSMPGKEWRFLMAPAS